MGARHNRTMHSPWLRRGKGVLPIFKNRTQSAKATSGKGEEGSIPDLRERTKEAKEDGRVNSEAVEETHSLSFPQDQGRPSIHSSSELPTQYPLDIPRSSSSSTLTSNAWFST